MMPSGISRIHLKKIDSTNDACALNLDKSKKSIVVTADQQSCGRGRNNNSWYSPTGNIYYSFGFISKNIFKGLSVKTGLIVAETLHEVYGKKVFLKWPNDLIYFKKKIGGILVESSSLNNLFKIVIGVGINLKITTLEDHWGDLGLDLNNTDQKDKFIEKLTSKLQSLSKYDLECGWSEKWTELCAHRNQSIFVKPNMDKHIFMGVNNNGEAITKKAGIYNLITQESSIRVSGLY